jgi:hypothetical protein
MLRIEKALLLRMQDYRLPGDELHITPPAVRTYPGTKLTVPSEDTDYARAR